MPALFCQTCKLTLGGVHQKDHYKSEWHRYNLKRKLVDLLPVDLDAYLAKLTLNQNLEAHNDQHYCETCAKNFSSNNAYKSHLNSKRHQLFVKAIPSCLSENINDYKIDAEKNNACLETSPIPDAIAIDKDSNCCLFCEQLQFFESIEDVLNHMQFEHSFQLPYTHKILDYPGYIKTLNFKINTCHICIWCHKQHIDSKSCKRHMKDKGHFKVKFELDCESIMDYLPFYTKKNFKLLVKNEDKLDQLLHEVFGSTYDFMQNMIEENLDEEDISYEPSTETFQLALPSGHVLGHRSLNIYYKQRLNPQTKVRSILSKSRYTNLRRSPRLYATSYLNHGLANSKSAAHGGFNSANITNLTGNKITKRELKRDKQAFLLPYKIQQRNALRVGLRANNQAHYRQQVDF